MIVAVVAITALVAGFASSAGVSSSVALQEWQTEFGVAERSLTDTGESRYFVLNPGYQMVLESRNEKVTITVLDETKEIGGVTTRVVEERSEEFGVLAEVALNYFALDPATGDVFYFGEDVDIYENGRLVSHDGSWLAYRDGNPGLIMPGDPLVGMKYYQEVAPGIAEDRAEVIGTLVTVTTPAGIFQNCVVMIESSELEPGVMDRKVFAPGVGLVESGSLRLQSYGYVR